MPNASSLGSWSTPSNRADPITIWAGLLIWVRIARSEKNSFERNIDRNNGRSS